MDGYTYVPYNGQIWRIDTSTGATYNTTKSVGPFFRGSYIVPVTGKQPIIYTLQAYGNLQKIDLGGSTVNTQLTLQAGPQTIESLASAPDGRIYMGGYLASIGAVYNPSNNVATTITGIEQVEGIGYYNGKMYLGCYSGATVRSVNANFGQTLTTVAADASTFTVPGQDRPFVIVGGDNLYVGTVPKIGENGGAISINKGTGTTQYMITADQFSIDTDNLQSVAGIAPFKVNGNEWFYVGSNVSGGTNAASMGEQAVITLFDQDRNVVNKNTMADMAAPGVTIAEKPKSIGHLIYSPDDGLIYGATMQSIFAIDPKINKIIRYKQIAPNAGYSTWNPAPVQLGPKGFLYTGIGGNLTLVNPKNFENYVVISGAGSSLMAVGGDNAVYYAKATSVYRVGTSLVDVGTSSANSVVVSDNADSFTVVPKTGLEAGNYTATVTISDGNSISESFNLSFEVTSSNGIKTPQTNLLKAYASDGLLYVSGLTAGETMSVYNLAGVLVYQSVATSDQMIVPLKAKGMYIVHTENDNIKVMSILGK